MQKDCWAKAAQSTQVAARTRSDTKGQRQTKEAKARREHPSMSGKKVTTISRQERKLMTRFQVSASGQSAETEGTTDKTGKFGKRFRSRRSVSDSPGVNAFGAEMGERIDLTIDSGCAACALPVGFASEVSIQELNRPPTSRAKSTLLQKLRRFESLD